MFLHLCLQQKHVVTPVAANLLNIKCKFFFVTQNNNQTGYFRMTTKWHAMKLNWTRQATNIKADTCTCVLYLTWTGGCWQCLELIVLWECSTTKIQPSAEIYSSVMLQNIALLYK